MLIVTNQSPYLRNLQKLLLVSVVALTTHAIGPGVAYGQADSCREENPASSKSLDYPVAGRDFQIEEVSGFGQSNQVAYGTSNGVGWAICGTNFSPCCGANTEKSYAGFYTPDFWLGVPKSDVLHIGQQDFRLVFEQPIKHLSFYAREDGGSANLDFGHSPVLGTGKENLRVDGTRVFPNTSGGSFSYLDLNTRELIHTSDRADGSNIAFYVEALADDAGPLTGSGKGLCEGPSLATPDVGRRDFVIKSVTEYRKEGQNAYGTSNGVGFAICNTNFQSGYGSSDDSSYPGFASENFDPPVPLEDSFHITHRDFTLVFEQPVDRVVFYAREDLGSANLDFGLVPEILSGASNITVNGTRVHANRSGGAFLFNNIDSNTLHHTSNVYDGTNIAFYVERLAQGAAADALKGSGEGLCDQLE